MQIHPRFGREVGTHEGRFGAGGWLWYLGGMLVLAGAMGFVQGVTGLFTQVPDALSKLGISLAAGTAGALTLLVAILRWRQKVVVFERGFVHTRLLGTREIGFDEVRSTQIERTRSRHSMTEELHIGLRDGREITIGSITNIEQLAAMIRHAPA